MATWSLASTSMRPWIHTCLFLYNISTATYTTLNIDLPGPIWMSGGISGNTIVGTYGDPVTNYGHGFMATIPEPSTISLLGMGAIGLLGYGLRRRWQKRITASEDSPALRIVASRAAAQ